MTNLLENYENQFDLDGALRPQPGVTEAKVKEAQKLWNAARRSRVAEAQLAELFTSSDLSYSIAHLLNVNTIPSMEEETKSIEGLAGVRTVRDFNPVVLRSLIGSAGVEGAGVDSRGAAAIVPEGTPYPIVTVKSDEESFYSKLSKRGVRFDFTFESIINDLLGELDQIPDDLKTITVKTMYAEIFDALDQATQHLQAATLIDGTQVAADAPVSAAALVAAAEQIENRTISGVKIGRISAYNVIVAPGQARFLEYDIAKMGRVIEVQDGNLTLGPDSALQALFPNVTIIESDRVSGTAWKMYPKPGSTARPVLERLVLRGYENAEIRVRNDQGFHPGGGKIGVFEGGFDADTASYRYRLITGATLWDDVYVCVSDGDGTVTP